MGSIAYVVILAVMFIWIMKSNKKNQQQAQQLQDSLRPGMYVMLRDGLFGTIVDVDGENVVINFSVDGADEGCLTVGKIGIYNVIEDNASAQQSAEATGAAAPGSIEEKIRHAEQFAADEDEEQEITDEHSGELEIAETPEETIAAPQEDAATPAEADNAAPAEEVNDSAAEQEQEAASADSESEGKED